MPPVVRLKLRVRLPDGSHPYLDPVYSANHKLKPGYASVDGKSIHFPDDIGTPATMHKRRKRVLRIPRRTLERYISDRQVKVRRPSRHSPMA
jgi:hypothetical protein